MQKITLTSSTRECITKGTFLGYEGENEVNKLVFEFTDGFKDGLGVLNIQRGEEYGYVSLEKVEGAYEFPVKSSILSKIGDIRFQVVITGNDGSVIKYDPFTMTVKDAIDAENEMPEEYPSWVDMANAKLAEVDEAITEAENVSNQLLEDKENGVFNGKDGVDGKDGINGKDGRDGINGKDGRDGVSPTFSTQQTETGATITITDVNGTHSVTLLNGADGQNGTNGKDGANGANGTNGKDGISPTITTERFDGGYRLTITDANGTQGIMLYDGIDGEDGADGTMSFEELTEEQKASLKGDKGDKGVSVEALEIVDGELWVTYSE